ncbi:MAG: hypothetical protein ABW321_32720 [Polyangiales bacterium]
MLSPSYALRTAPDRALRITLLATLVGILGTGCASLSSKPPQAPDVMVREFARALGDGRAADAYALMSPAYRQRVTLATWKTSFEANPQEVTEAEARLARVRGPVELEAQLQHADGATLELVQDAGYWYIASEEIDFYDQSSPRAALRSFVAALTRRRYDVVLRLVPEADKEGVTTESLQTSFGHAARDDVERLLSQLRTHLDAPIEIDGARATMPYAEHKRVQFVRESDHWCIEDPD